MVVDNRDGSEADEFRYYDLGGIPVRVALRQGYPFGADYFNPATNALERNVALLSGVERDPFSDEISEADFYRRCADLRKAQVSQPDDLNGGHTI